jgi:Domain of unknown function (DUF4845)
MKVQPSRQRGLTFISMILLACAIGAVVLTGMQVIPIYLDHSKVTGALKALQAMDGASNMSEFEVRSNLAKRFNMNYVYDVKEDDIKIVKNGSYLRISIQYEVVKKLVGNLSVLAEFDDMVEIGQK